MLRSTWLTVAMWVCCLSPSLAEDGAKFNGTADLKDTVQIVRNFSDDGKAATVIFRNLDTVVDSGQSAPSRTVTVSLPIANAGQEISLTQDVRGFVSRSSSTNAFLVVCSGGKTTVVDLDESGSSKPPAQSRSVKQLHDRTKKEAGDSPDDERPEGSNFFHRIEGTVAPGSDYQVTFFLLLDSPTTAGDDAGGYLAVDSLDVEIRDAGSSANLD